MITINDNYALYLIRNGQKRGLIRLYIKHKILEEYIKYHLDKDTIYHESIKLLNKAILNKKYSIYSNLFKKLLDNTYKYNTIQYDKFK